LKQKEEKALLIFLKQIREGKYAKMDVAAPLSYPRIKEQREELYNEDEFYYSIR
jgi:hypothetical protein